VPRYYHTEGICLRRLDYSNTSQVASFITADAGRLSFLAKGVTRAPKKGIRTGFDLLGRYDIVYTMRRRSTLHNLTDRWLKDGFPGVRRSLPAILCGYYAAELASNFTAEEEPCPQLYERLLWTLGELASGPEDGLSLLMLELGALREHGSCPQFHLWAECGRSLPERGPVAFCPAGGGPLCRRCERQLPDWQRGAMTTAGADQLRMLAALSVARPDELAGLDATPDRIAAAGAVLKLHIRHVLGKELRMWRYVQQRHLERSLRTARRRAGLR
jgi:DNA repair protein RecO